MLLAIPTTLLAAETHLQGIPRGPWSRKYLGVYLWIRVLGDQGKITFPQRVPGSGRATRWNRSQGSCRQTQFTWASAPVKWCRCGTRSLPGCVACEAEAAFGKPFLCASFLQSRIIPSISGQQNKTINGLVKRYCCGSSRLRTGKKQTRLFAFQDKIIMRKWWTSESNDIYSDTTGNPYNCSAALSFLLLFGHHSIY